MALPNSQPYFLSQKNKILIDAIMATRSKHPVNILVKGKHGMGKSAFARQLSVAYKMADYVPVPIGSLQETGQLMGHKELVRITDKDGNTVGTETKFMTGKFIEAVKTPNCLIHLEELNRPESPKALNDLFPLLDDGRCLVHEELGKIDVAPGIVFVATLNEGFEYTGIDPLDAALEDRFCVINMDYLPPQTESMVIMTTSGLMGEKATQLLQFVNKLRMDGQEPIHISTRKVIMMAELIVNGLDMKSAIISNVALDKERLESVLLGLDFSGHGLNSGKVDESKFVLL